MKEIHLPFGEAIKRSFNFVFSHLSVYIRLSLFWGMLTCLIDACEGFPSLCPIGSENCVSEQKLNLYQWSLFFGGISIIISYIIYVITKTETGKYFRPRFGTKDFKYIWAMLKLIFAAVLLSVIIGLLFGVIGSILKLGSLKQIGIIFSAISFFIISMYLSRYILVFPGIAIEDAEMSFNKSFELTKGNINAIFWGLFLLALPMSLVNIFVSSLYFAIRFDNVFLNLIFSFSLTMIGFLNDTIKASFLAHIYQYFIYFDKKQKQVSDN